MATRKPITHVYVSLVSESEEGTQTVRMTIADAKLAKKLLNAQSRKNDGGEWPDEVNAIIDRSEIVPIYGTINSMGDGWGWYTNEETKPEWPRR